MFIKATTLCTVFILSLSSISALVWPTPNPAFSNGESIESFVQATASGNPISGLYGCVRNGGERFHEGLDLFGLKRDAEFEVLDSVFSVLPGFVAYVNEDASRSRYGRYIVITHSEAGVTFYSLYAHLQSVDALIHTGTQVKEGQRIGRMGRSAGGYIIPKDRAHLHFELGVKLSDQFQKWYDQQSFETKNWHSNWNGMNLMGVDPLDFYRSIRARKVSSFGEYLSHLKARLKLHVRFSGTPSFLKANTKFIQEHSIKESEVAGWEVVFSQYGIPNVWKPLKADALGLPPGQDFKVIAVNQRDLDQKCCALWSKVEGKVEGKGKGDQIRLSKAMLTHLAKLFVR